MTNDKRTTKLLLLSILIFLGIVVLTGSSLAEDSNCGLLTGDAKDKCEELEKKAETYQNIIDLKNKQQDTLEAQVKQIDKQQATTITKLQTTQTALKDTSGKIDSLKRDIKDKERQISAQKIILSGLIQAYYDYDQFGLLEVVIADENLTDVFGQSDYIEQSQIKVRDILAGIQKTRNELQASQNELEKKLDEHKNLEDSLIEQKNELQSTENQKKVLLAQTQGEEEKYQKLLERVEEQKKELFNFSEASNLDEINASVDSYEKPKTNLASTSWYFSQKDSRWGDRKIGNSSSLMKDYGCAITSVSMVFRKIGSSIDPGKLAKEKIYSFDLIKWPGSWEPNINLISGIAHGNINWSTIDSQIKKGHPVIVFIKKANGRGGHYVVVTGKDSKDYIVHDPYFGPNLYLGTSRALVGKIGVDSKTMIDQMIIYN